MSTPPAPADEPVRPPSPLDTTPPLPSSDLIRKIEALVPILRDAKSIIVLTGAGISAESGINTFRDTMKGLWKDFDPATLATPEAFVRNPELVTKWYDWRRLGCLAAEPNPGHVALAQLQSQVERFGGNFTLFTQNVDRLHQRAGSREVVELHGSIIEWRCVDTDELFEPSPVPFARFPPPSPYSSGSILRPNVVWFGEALPELALRLAFDRLPRCDVFFTIGTSSVVFPAAGFIDIAADNGAYLVEINPATTPATGRVDMALQETAAKVLPYLLARTWG